MHTCYTPNKGFEIGLKVLGSILGVNYSEMVFIQDHGEVKKSYIPNPPPPPATRPTPGESSWVCIGNVLISANYPCLK